MTFSEALDQYLDLRDLGPAEKGYYARVHELRSLMDAMVAPPEQPKESPGANEC
jgi:hypothetical protein